MLKSRPNRPYQYAGCKTVSWLPLNRHARTCQGLYNDMLSPLAERAPYGNKERHVRKKPRLFLRIA